jgi:NAD(P)-dependent dehydrogenase (short-subunit alcohol dehydrogenase family)
MKRSQSKVVLITGAASGIGAAAARRAAVVGHTVVIADIDERGAAVVAADIGAAATAVRLDIRSEAEWTRVLDDVWALHGRLDVLVNNAAIVHTGFARDVPLARHEQTIATNFMGAVTGMLSVLPRFQAQGSGHIVNVSSMTAFIPFPGIASYAAAKHALRAFHHGLALEERHGPVKFTIVYPTATETPMLDKEAEDDAMALAFAGTPMTPEAVGEAILEAVRKQSVEVYLPPERGKVVRRLGTSPRALRKMVERNEVIGAEKLAARRARRAAPGDSPA